MLRGTFRFEATPAGDLVDSSSNVETLRKLWLDRRLITALDLGPGNPGDFDYGAWHVACHLVAAAGVKRAANGDLLWFEISHDPVNDEYYASVSLKDRGTVKTYRLDSADGQSVVSGSTLLGFIEGNSVGRTSARGISDPPDRFNRWQRQDFDQLAATGSEGGKVWEHWCALRDLRPSARIGLSVLRAYVSLASALGDRFAPAVARGRRSYGHPKQLSALVRAGFTSESSALWDTSPFVLARDAERLLEHAEPGKSLEAVEKLDWSNPPRYYMFARRARQWSSTAAVRRDLRAF